MTLLIVSAFALAMIPLFSLVFEVVKRGLPGISLEFFTEDARGKVAGGGALHAIVGTAGDHRRRRPDLGPDRADGGDLHERVRDRAACAARSPSSST